MTLFMTLLLKILTSVIVSIIFNYHLRIYIIFLAIIIIYMLFKKVDTATNYHRMIAGPPELSSYNKVHSTSITHVNVIII